MGTLEDWKKLYEGAMNLSEYGFDWWLTSIGECLLKIIDSYEGNVDKDFWKYIYKFYPG